MQESYKLDLDDPRWQIIINDPRLVAYRKLRREHQANQKPVSAEEAMAQIIRNSPCPRKNPYIGAEIIDNVIYLKVKNKDES